MMSGLELRNCFLLIYCSLGQHVSSPAVRRDSRDLKYKVNQN